MTWPGHLAFSYLTTTTFLHIVPEQISETQLVSLYVTGFVASIAPDLDFIPFFIKHQSLTLQKNDSHRSYISHAPLLWLFILFVVGVLLFRIGNQTALFFDIIFIVNVLGHFIGDSMEYGVMWSWPISRKLYCLHHIPQENLDSYKKYGPVRYYWEFFRQEYIYHWTFYIDLACIFSALGILVYT